MQEKPATAPAAPEPAPARFRVPAAAKHALKFGLGAAALYALIRSGSLEPRLVGRAFVQHPALCALAFLSFGTIVLIPAWYRWLLLLRLAGIQAAPGRVFKLHMIGVFFNSLIPGGTGGDLVKGFYLFKDQDAGKRALALTSMAMDRFLGLYALLCVGVAMMAVNADLWMAKPLLRLNSLFYAGVFLVFTLSIAFFFSPWSRWFLEHPRLHAMPGGRFFKSLFDSLMVYRANPWGLLPTLGLAILVDFGIILMYFFFAGAVGGDLPLRVHAFVVPTLTMINGIPISPGGLGVGEAAGKVVYEQLGMASGGEVLALVHICVMAFSLCGAPFYFLFRSRER